MTNNLQELRELIIKETRPEGSLYVGPVDLAKVLLSLRDFGQWRRNNDDCYIEKEKNQLAFIYDNGIYFDWDLTKDLCRQSQETIDNLLKLIKGE